MNRLYARVSTTEQTTASQRPELEQWATGKEAKLYEDKVSGKTLNRPAFQKMLKECKSGDTIVVVRLDRLGRTASGLTALFEELRRRKINLVSLREGIDLNTIAGTFVANVLASVAAFETELRQERINAGIAAKRERVAKGLEVWNVGRPKGTGKVTKTLRASILSQHKERLPIARIAKEHGVSRVTVYAVVKGEQR